MELAPQFVVGSQLCEILFEAKRLEHSGVDAEGHRGDVPIFQAHGLHDPLVLVDYGRQTRDFLQQEGYSVEWCEYPMDHQVCPQEIEDVGRWLRRVLSR